MSSTDAPVRVRMAPSPTGSPHVGMIRTALFNWAFARHHGGTFVFRIEDTDKERSTEESYAAIIDLMRWLGLDWDEGPDVGGPHAPYLQSQRTHLYEAALEHLRTANRTFHCYLSRAELAEVASAPHGPVSGVGKEGVYGEAERAASRAVASEKAQQGRRPSTRFLSPALTVRFHDVYAGPQRVDARGEVGHFVVKRADGLFAYQLAVVVDDAAMGITEVVRGADLLQSTAAQLLLYATLGLRPPSFAHVPLMLGADGKRLAKRRGSQTLHELRQQGTSPAALVGTLAHSLGIVPTPAPITPRQLLERFDAAAPLRSGALPPRE